MRKKQIVSVHAKTLDRMKREVNHAVSRVEFLNKLYREMIESNKKENK